MATALTTIFGDEIKVYAQPRNIDRQYVGFPGANGVVSMHLGTRGRQIVVTGTIYGDGANYAAARTACQVKINAIESYFYPDVQVDSYSFMGETFYNAVFDKFQLIPDSEGKVFHYTVAGYVIVSFICYLREQV